MFILVFSGLLTLVEHSGQYHTSIKKDPNKYRRGNMKIYSKRWGRVALLAMLLALLALGLTTSSLVNTVHAAEIRNGDHVIVAADEVIDDDLFISGQKVEVEGTVNGDLFAAANEVIINGTVEGSLFIGGQTLQINGDVKGSTYGGGYSLTIGREAQIERNLYFGGFSLQTEKGSAVGRSVYASGYQVILNGDIADNVVTGSGALEINGTVGGDVKAQVNEQRSAPLFMPNFPGSVPMVATGYRLGEEAKIGGQENIEVTGEVDVGKSVADYAWDVLRGRLGEFITLLIVGGLLLWLWPTMMQSTSTAAQKKPLPSAGWGCLVTLVFPILLAVAIIALVLIAILIGLITFDKLNGAVISIGATSIAWIAIVFNFIFFTVTKVIVAFLVGRLILTRFAPQMKSLWLNIASLALGALIYELLRVIPVVGWIVALIAILVGLGAMFMAARQRPQPAAPESIPPLPDIDPSPEIAEPFDEPDTVEEIEIPNVTGLPGEESGIPEIPEPPDETDFPQKSDAT